MEGRFGLSPNLGWGRAMKSACTTQPDEPFRLGHVIERILLNDTRLAGNRVSGWLDANALRAWHWTQVVYFVIF